MVNRVPLKHFRCLFESDLLYSKPQIRDTSEQLRVPRGYRVQIPDAPVVWR